jgi:alternate signal-mediated exported protein
MKRIKNKKALGIAALVGGLVAIGGTVAYYSDTMHFNNLFGIADYVVDYTENFESPENWAPCAETPKTITATNRGNTPIGVRIKLDQSWKSQSGENLPLTMNVDGEDLSIASINLDESNRDKWLFDGEYYYYYRALEPGETTESLLKSVTFNCKVNLVSDEITYTQTEDGIIGMSSQNEYLKSKFHLNVRVQSIQRNAMMSTWHGPAARFPEGWVISHEGWAPYSKYFTTSRIAPVVKIERVDSLPDYEVISKNTAPTDGVNYMVKLDDGTTDIKLYAWIEDNTLKFYTNAPVIMTNKDMNYAFEHYTNLTDISELGNWYWGETETLSDTFRGDKALTDISALSAIKDATITDVARIFSECNNLEDISVLSQWKTKIRGGINNYGMMAAFESTSISDVTPIKDWDVSEANDFAFTFANTKVTDTTPLENWDMHSAQRMQYMFSASNQKVSSINTSGLVNWDLSGMRAAARSDAFTKMFNKVVDSAPTTGSWSAGSWDSKGTFSWN